MSHFNKLMIKEKVRNHCPNIRAFRKALSSYRLKELNQFHSLERMALESGDGPDRRKRILDQAKRKYSAEYARIDKLTKKTLQRTQKYMESWQDSERLDDILFCYFAMGFLPDEYVYFALEKKDMQERLSFMTVFLYSHA